MITAIVILGSIALAVAFAAAWAFKPSLRRDIESPKYWFNDQARQYDRTRQMSEEHKPAPNVPD